MGICVATVVVSSQCNEVVNGSAVQGGPQEVASGCTCSSDGNTDGGEWLQRLDGEQCGKHLCYLNKNDLDLEARISDIYHVISFISHFLWIL